MTALLQFLIDHGLVLLTGTTALLTLGLLFMLCQRSPVHRQRIGETTILATLVWLVLTCVPLPRLSLNHDRPVARPEPPAPLPEISTAALTESRQLHVEEPEPPVLFDHAITGSIEPEPESTAPIFPPITPTPTPFDWPRAGARAYLLGLAACTCWILLGHILLRRLVRTAHAPDPWLAELFHELNAPAKSRLLVSPTASRPISCGLHRPTIILPEPCASPDRLHQLRQVLRHELAHVAQRDSLGHALFNLALPILYFHPLYWLIRARTFLARELVADDRAAAAADSKESYVSELIALAAARFAPARRPTRLNVIGIFESTTHFYRRMHMLLERQSQLPTRCSTWWRLTAVTTASLLIGTSTLFVGVNRAHAQTAPERAQDQEITALRQERDQLAARLKEMEIRFNQMEARMQVLRAESQAQEADRRLRMRAEEDQRRAADQQPAREQRQLEQRTQQAVNEEARKTAVERRTEYQRDQARSGRRVPATAINPDTGQPAAAADAAAGIAKSTDAPRDMNYAGGQRLQLDLVTLANAYIDASGNQRLREIQVQRFAQLAQNNVASQGELETAQVELDMAKRKTRLFRSMAEAALRAAEAELDNAKRLAEKGFVAPSEVHNAESKVLVLRQILSN